MLGPVSFEPTMMSDVGIEVSVVILTVPGVEVIPDLAAEARNLVLAPAAKMGSPKVVREKILTNHFAANWAGLH